LSDSRPIIGVTTYRQEGTTGVWDGEFAMIPGSYLSGIERSGGSLMLIPPQDLDAAHAARMASMLDGLMVCGGRDVDPARYGKVALSTTEEPDRRRDQTEDALLAAAIEAGLPVLGICRGAQILNVHRGGTLLQHVPDVIGDNRYQKGGGEFTMMNMFIVEDTRLSDIYSDAGEIGPAAVYHHQAIDEVGEGLRVSAWSPDGLVEAIELDGHPFCVAVQWHPEKTLEDLRLFQALVAHAESRREARR
jgi:putative glutamine amidotransferase